jgi:hypothetical protein
MKTKLWIGNFDGRRQGLVIAATKKRAREIVGRSVTEFNSYWHEMPLDRVASSAGLEAEVLYTRPFDAKDDVPWQKGRCPL